MHHVLQSPSLEMIFEEFITSLLNKKSYGPIKARRIPLLLSWFPFLQHRRFWQSFNRFKGFVHLILRQWIVCELATEIGVVTTQIHETMTTPVEKDDFFLPLFFSLLCLFNNDLYGMTGLRCWNLTFGSRPLDSSSIALQLIISSRLKQSLNDQLAHQGSGAKIP